MANNREESREIKRFIGSSGRFNQIEVVIFTTDRYKGKQYKIRNYWIDKITSQRKENFGVKVSEKDLKKLGALLISVAESAEKEREQSLENSEYISADVVDGRN